MKHRGGYDSWLDHKEPKAHSKKNCWCGGHNNANPKSNKRHHGTLMRIWVRQGRNLKAWMLRMQRRSDKISMDYEGD